MGFVVAGWRPVGKVSCPVLHSDSSSSKAWLDTAAGSAATTKSCPSIEAITIVAGLSGGIQSH